MLSTWPLVGLSMLALLLGAGMGFGFQGRGWGIAGVKGLMASFIGGVILFHLLPDAYRTLGPISILWMVGGFLLIVFVEKLAKQEDHHSHKGRFFTAEMLWFGLVLHQLTDGIGLALAGDQVVGDWFLALTVIAHRIPVAAVVVWLFLREGKPRQAWLRILGMGLATLVGAMFYRTLAPWLSSGIISGVYAFICGSFLHLLTHDFLDHHAHGERDRVSEFFGFFIGLVLLYFAFQSVPGGAHAVGDAAGHAAHGAGVGGDGFFTLLLLLIKETAPYLLLGLIVSGIIQAFMPASPIVWLQRGGPLKQSLKGMGFGLPLPICSCGVLPLFMSLAKKGVPPAGLVAFLIATPELGIDSFLLSVKLLGWKFSIVRLIVAIILPVCIALIAVRFFFKSVQVQEPEAGGGCCKKGGHGADAAKDSGVKWWRFAFVDLVDDILPLVMFGLLVAALAQTLWPTSSLGEMTGAWDVLILGLLGIPFYVCASASVPFALVLLQHGFSIGAVVVFLFAGPATNVATILTVNKVFGPNSGLKLAGVALLCACAFGFLINGFYKPEDLGVLELHEHGWSLIDYVSTGAIVLLGLFSMWRLGPLHWISVLAGLIPGLVNHPPKGKDAHAGKRALTAADH